jgi:cell division protein FtsW
VSRTAERRRDPLPLRRRAQRPSARLDLAILLTSTALLVIGLVMNLSASSVSSVARTGSAFTLFGRQFLWAAIGFAALVVGSRIDYRRLRGLTYACVPAVWALLLLTLHPSTGARAFGASRWLTLGPVSVQPSEAAKLVMLLFGADVLSRKAGLLGDWRHVMLPFLAAVGITGAFILMQPDFGTAVIIGATALVVAFLAGTPVKFLGTVTGSIVLVGIPVMLSEGYRRDRLFGFLHRDSDALNTGFQSVQGLVALGTGRLFGMGLGSSRQKYFYLPNAHTDFIFAILGEETGLAGTLTVLVLFAVLAMLGIRAARRAPDLFGFLVAAGVTAWISIQVLVNLGAVTGVLPITGVPLPLISFGGSSLVFSLAGLGLVASVARQGSSSGSASRC